MLRPVCLLLLSAIAGGQSPLADLSPAEQAEARRLMDAIRRDPRGPYGAIAWYCKDGRTLPPKGTPCGKPGGFQHAEPSAASRRLAVLGVDLAYFLAGRDFDSFFDFKRNHYGLREIVMRDFLSARRNGWVYARTFARRGVKQVEDEEAEGRRLLATLLGRHDWVAGNYLLTMQLVAAVPHGVASSRTREIRSLSASLAEAMPAFQPLRGKIHSQPEAGDIAVVEEFVRTKKPDNEAGFSKLLELMRAEYGAAGSSVFDLAAGAKRSLELRRQLSSPGLTSTQRLRAADEQYRIQMQAFQSGAKPIPPGTRRERLKETGHWLKIAAGGGWLSMRQLAALEGDLNRAVAASRLEPAAYSSVVSYLEGAAEWARAATVKTFGEVEARYTLVEPLASALTDELLRSSTMLPLMNRIERLSRDAGSQAGISHRLLETSARPGIRALNPGVSIGPLDFIDGAGQGAEIEPGRIYVIPATVAELKPMRGILTLDSGNALSHAQLLAANLGIPNATVPSSLLPELRKYRGQEMFYAVTPGGSVILRPWASLSAAEQKIWKAEPVQRKRIALDTSKTKTSDAELRFLEETSMADSGVICGPKAANLGQLKRLFPDTVAPGIVIPFGVYYRHAARKDAGGQSVVDRVRAAATEMERMRGAGASSDALRAAIRPRLAEIRAAIRGLVLEPPLVAALSAKLKQAFGPDGTYGVFVRSDTNAEDLPQFTGAGLNLTLPNVVGEARIMEAIKEVWASPFEERAWAWRSEALEATDRVYPSVVLLRTVPAEKSGVMATANLATLDLADLTVNVNEGVAAVVDGGVSESLLLTPDGGVRLLAQAQLAYKKVPLPEGDFARVPTSASDEVLAASEIAQLRRLAVDVQAKLKRAKDAEGADLPWDIEFGFEKRQLRLFQIRPLVRFRASKTLSALGALDSRARSGSVDLDGPLED